MKKTIGQSDASRIEIMLSLLADVLAVVEDRELATMRTELIAQFESSGSWYDELLDLIDGQIALRLLRE